MGKLQDYQNYCDYLGIYSLVILTACLFAHEGKKINAFSLLHFSPRCTERNSIPSCLSLTSAGN